MPAWPPACSAWASHVTDVSGCKRNEPQTCVRSAVTRYSSSITIVGPTETSAADGVTVFDCCQNVEPMLIYQRWLNVKSPTLGQ